MLSAIRSVLFAPARAVAYVARSIAHRFSRVGFADQRSQAEARGIVNAAQTMTLPHAPLISRTKAAVSHPASVSFVPQGMLAAGIQGTSTARQQAYDITANQISAKKLQKANVRLFSKIQLVDMTLLSSITVESLNANQGLTKAEAEAMSLVAVLLKRIAKYLPEHAEQANQLLEMRILGMELKNWKNDKKFKGHFIEHKANWQKYSPLAKDFCKVRLPEIIALIQTVKAELEAELTANQPNAVQELMNISTSPEYRGLMQTSLKTLSHRGFTTEECILLSRISQALQSDTQQSSELKKEVERLLNFKILGMKFKNWKNVNVASRYAGKLNSGDLSQNVSEGHSYHYFVNVIKSRIQYIMNVLTLREGTLV